MKRIITSLVLCLYAVIMPASVTLDGVNYDINQSNKTAKVVKSECSGDLEIPEHINVDGVDYEVTEKIVGPYTT